MELSDMQARVTEEDRRGSGRCQEHRGEAAGLILE